MNTMRRRPLTITEILLWVAHHRAVTGKWPTKNSGAILGALFETWMAVDTALRAGLRTLPGGSSLAKLLAEKRGVRNIHDIPPLTEEQILQWADEYFHRKGSWPTVASGAIANSGGEKWAAVNQALRSGLRGLPGGSSLARLLKKHRGVRNRKQLSPLTKEKIWQWASVRHARIGEWPDAKSGPITDSPGDTWLAVDMALRHGRRQLPGGSSLALLLAEKRGVPHRANRPDLTIELILAWADAFYARTGRWPNLESGSILEAPEETWGGVNHALRRQSRGLTVKSSLAKLLAKERGVRNQGDLPRLRRNQIIRWAKAHFRRTGQWPTTNSGTIPEAPEETWAMVDAALNQGQRGLGRPGSSLAKLLAEAVGKVNIQDMPPLSRRKILDWADAHYQRTGTWPNTTSGSVTEAPGERWDLIDNALRIGRRGLPGGSSLLQLLAKKRGVRNTANLPPLTEEEILQWAEEHFKRAGSWPKYYSGPIADAPGETWVAIDNALRFGRRGMAGGSSLAKLLKAAGKNTRSSALAIS
jgi:hypothetical protein